MPSHFMKILLAASAVGATSPILAEAASFGLPSIYEIDARDRAKIIGVITQSHADDSYVREHLTVKEIYGVSSRRPLECNAGVTTYDPSDLEPWQKPEFITHIEVGISVCVGR